LIRYKDTSRLSFRKIAAQAAYDPIPADTLCSVYNGAELPKTYWAAQNIVSAYSFKYPHLKIRLDDPRSAARTLAAAAAAGRLSQNYIATLIDEIYSYFPDPCEIIPLDKIFNPKRETMNIDKCSPLVSDDKKCSFKTCLDGERWCKVHKTYQWRKGEWRRWAAKKTNDLVHKS